MRRPFSFDRLTHSVLRPSWTHASRYPELILAAHFSLPWQVPASMPGLDISLDLIEDERHGRRDLMVQPEKNFDHLYCLLIPR